MSKLHLARHPKIYVVTEEPCHDNSTLRFATLDIDQAFTFAQKLLTDHGGLTEIIEIHELDGEAGISGSWSMRCESQHPDYRKWFFHATNTTHFGTPYEHVREGSEKRKERLIEAAEIVMNLAVMELPSGTTGRITHERAKRQRERTLAQQTELLTACECEYPIRILRNGHGHGTTVDGLPCPAIAVHERFREEHQEREDVL